MLLFVVFLSMRILAASRIAWSSALKLDASLPTDLQDYNFCLSERQV